jgi:predicted glycoside hydrolase/deacetylase ChbG (UPF0249 family)
MTKRLIVNSDDYGRTPGVSAGIREAHLRGIVTSTTAMMNMPGVEAGLELALRDCPRLGLGVHLVLTSGAPVSAAKDLPALTGPDGRFLGVRDFRARVIGLDVAQVLAEWRAQIEKFVAATGRHPDHLDSHHHSSFYTPALLRAMLELAREYGCPVRRIDMSEGELVYMMGEAAQPFAAELRAIRDEFGPKIPDFFERDFYDESATLEYLQAVLDRLPEGVSELMCHPGYVDEDLLGPAGSVYNRQRAGEVAVLTDPSVRARLEQHGIRLINFGDL